MYCNQCGSDVPPAAIACPACGTRLTTQGLASPAGPAGTAGRAAAPAGAATAPAFRLDPHRWTGGDRITGASTVLLFVSLFLPWYGISFLGVSAQADGLTGHGYLYLVLLLCLAILGYLVTRAAAGELPGRLPLTHERLLLIATGLNAVLVLIAFLTKPDGTGWRFGAFVGLLTALVAVAPLVTASLRSRRAGA
jgi:FtsH-binding integral membrane protein